MKFLVLTVALMLGASAFNKSDERQSDIGTGARSNMENNMEAEMAPEELDAPAGTDSEMDSGSAVDPDTDMNSESGTDVGTGTSPDSFSEEGYGQGEDIQSDENIDSGERDESLQFFSLGPHPPWPHLQINFRRRKLKVKYLKKIYALILIFQVHYPING